MKNLFYIIVSFFFVLNASAERVMLAEGEIIVLDTTASEAMSVQKNAVESPENEANITTNKTPDIAPENGQVTITEKTQAEQSGFSQGSVTRSIFTTQVSDHEPIDKLDKLQSSKRSVFYFTELRDMSGQTAIHRWEFNGNVMAETKFNIAGPRWRVWSSKNLLPSWIGEWKVSVLNGVGDVISEDIFSYVEAKMIETTPQGTELEAQEVISGPELGYTNDKLNP